MAMVRSYDEFNTPVYTGNDRCRGDVYNDRPAAARRWIDHPGLPTRLDGGHLPELRPLLLLDYHKQKSKDDGGRSVRVCVVPCRIRLRF